MCGRSIKRGLSALLCCWLLVVPVICSAATITLTPEEKARWTLNSNLLDRKLQVLEMSLPQSAKDLLTAEEKLRQSEARLERQEALLLQYENALNKTQETLKKFEESLMKTEQLLKQERDERKKEVNRLKTEKIIWTIIGVGAGYLVGSHK